MGGAAQKNVALKHTRLIINKTNRRTEKRRGEKNDHIENHI